MTSSAGGPHGQLELAATYLRQLQGNAESLLSDADLLFEHQRWARSLVLAVLAMEEAGKAILATASLVPDGDLAELKPTRHEDKLVTAALLDAGFSGDLSDLQALFGQIDAVAIHREKLSAIYVDRRGDSVVSPSSVTADDAERAITTAKRVVELLSGILTEVSSEVIEWVQQLTGTLNPALDKYVLDHGEAAGLRLARDLLEWGRRTSCRAAQHEREVTRARPEATLTER